MLKAYGRFSQKTLSLHGISFGSQISGISRLALLYGIPPVFYYRYGMFLAGRKDPFEYIYTFQVRHWHMAMCGARDVKASIALLADKEAFAERMSQKGLPSTSTLTSFKAGDTISSNQLFCRKSLFLKPTKGSQMKGCFALKYSPGGNNSYRLIGEKEIEGKDAILQHVQERIAEEDYILQPLLTNHPDLEGITNPDGLVTLRVVTGHDEKESTMISAILEIPIEKEGKWVLRKVDESTGVILQRPEFQSISLPEGHEEEAKELAGATLPLWQDVSKTCLLAHEEFTDVPAIGWDVAITPEGATLIEGNFCWRVDPEHSFSDTPLLKTSLLDIYQRRITRET